MYACPAKKPNPFLLPFILALLATLPLAAQLSPRALPMPRDLDLSASARHESLTFVPIVMRSEGVSLPAFLTFAEGLAAGLVEIREVGGAEDRQASVMPPPAARQATAESPPAAQQEQSVPPFEAGRIQGAEQRVQSLGAGDGARVNALVIRNRSQLPLLVLAGDIVAGGKQNRVIRADLIVPPGEDFLELPVFCVEQGRWSVDPATGKADFGASGAGMAEQSLRKAVLDSAEQREVWSTVERLNEKRGAGQSDYSAGVLQEELQKRVAAVYSNLAPAIDAQLVVGVAAYHSGCCIGLDLFASPSLFAAYRERLARAYILEALERDREGILKASMVVPEPDARRRLEALASARRGEVVHSTDVGVFFRIEAYGLTGGALLYRGEGGTEASGEEPQAELLVHLGLVEAD